jgi:menaquinone-dependent protoporphyrinogen oxidase
VNLSLLNANSAHNCLILIFASSSTSGLHFKVGTAQPLAADGLEHWASQNMPQTLIAYSSIDGHTLRMCGRVRQVIEQAGGSVALFDLDTDRALDLAPFDTVVIGASIRYGQHRPSLYRFIESHRDALDNKPSAFFSVNVVARKVGKDTPLSNPYVRAFRRKTTWVPGEIGVFAGKIDYPKYGFVDRQVIRFIMWLTNGPTDTSVCTEFTDWQAVDNFAQRVRDLGSAGAGRVQSCADSNGSGNSRAIDETASRTGE